MGNRSKTAKALNNAFPPRTSALITLALFSAFFGVFFVLFFTNSFRYLHCVIYAVTGFYCPGCGFTRALRRLMRCDILSALNANPLIVIALPVFVYEFITALITAITNKRVRWKNTALQRVIIAALFVLVLTFTVLRNIPVHPFALLAP